MILDARNLPPAAALRAEVCIAGSGPAGITLALELARAGKEVVLLEAGGYAPEAHVADAARAEIPADVVHDPLELASCRLLGGTSTEWGGRCAPLDPFDFEPRPGVTPEGWPLSYSDLLPFYRRTHAYLGLGRFEYRASDALEQPRPFISDPELTDDALWRWSYPVNFWREYGSRLERMAGVRVLHHATLATLQRDAVDGPVTRASVLTAPGHGFEVWADDFVLAVGGVETARILLRSDDANPAGLGNAHGLVGRHYMTHPVAEVGVLRLHDAARARAGAFMRTRDGVHCRRMLKLSHERQRADELLNLACALWYPDPRDPAHGDPLLSSFALTRYALTRSGRHWKSSAIHRRYGQPLDVGAHLGNVSRGLAPLARFGVSWVRGRYLSERRLPSFMPDHGRGPLRLRFDAEQSPEPENRITLSRERDALGLQRVRISYRVSASDRRSIAHSVRAIGDAIERSAAGRLDLPPTDDWAGELEFADGTHPMGVARMATNPSLGVVDADCRLHDCPNVRVLGSAVFPTGGSVGPTMTIIALALRAAEDMTRAPRVSRPRQATHHG